MSKKLLGIFVVIILVTTFIPTAAIGIGENRFFEQIAEPINDVDWWPMYGHDPQHTSCSTCSAPNENKINWSYETGSEIRFSSSVVVDNKLYIGTGEIESIGMLDIEEIMSKPVINYLNENIKSTYSDTGGIFCIDTITGEKLWDFVTEGVVSSTPVVYNGNIYVLTTSSETYEGYLYCIEAETGLEQWSSEYTNLITTPTIYNDNLYVSIVDIITGDGKLLCLDPSDGEEIWNHSAGFNQYAMYSSPAAYDDRVFYITINTTDIKLHCVDATTGMEHWTIFLTKMEVGMVVSTPVIDGERIFVMSLESYIANETVWSVLFSINAENGDINWKHVMDEFDISLTTPAVADDVVYFSYVENYWAYGGIACLNADDGEVIWDKRLYNDFFTVSTPSIADGKIFIGGMNLVEVASLMNCFDIDTGSLIWNYPIGEISMVDNSPAIVDGKVFIADYGGTIFAFKDNTPPNGPVIDGPDKGGKETEIGFVISSEDFDGDYIIEFIINWGDNISDEIITGPFESGERVIVSHIWEEKGKYLIKAKAKDSFGDESNWSEFEINIPRTKQFCTTSFQWLVELFPFMIKLLQRILFYK
jgi:outer membrane protein assembly factor BamB